MTFAYPQVNVAGNNYNAYGTQQDADVYLGAAIAYDGWGTADDDTKGKAIVSATRWLNTLQWLGTLDAGAVPPMAFPRDGLANTTDGIIPQGVTFAMFEIAAGLVDDPTLLVDNNDPIAKTLSASAGLNITFFRPHDVFWAAPVPKAALAYIQPYLASISPAGGPTPVGFRFKSPLDRKDDFFHGL
jgi:hypothetical protein